MGWTAIISLKPAIVFRIWGPRPHWPRRQRGDLAVLEIDHGAIHTECRVNGDDVTIMEVNPRLAGGKIGSHLVEMATGCSAVRAMLDAALGKQPNGTRCAMMPQRSVSYSPKLPESSAASRISRSFLQCQGLRLYRRSPNLERASVCHAAIAIWWLRFWGSGLPRLKLISMSRPRWRGSDFDRSGLGLRRPPQQSATRATAGMTA